nr:CAP domain-containing protein [Angustibacter aerolatus]
MFSRQQPVTRDWRIRDKGHYGAPMLSRLSTPGRWAAVVALAATAVVPVTTAASAEAAPSAAAQNRYEAKVQKAMNAARSDHERKKLKTDKCANHYAEAWARKISNRSIQHQDLGRILAKCHAVRASENIARGNVGSAKMVSLWMHSPGHKANLLDKKVTRVGVATVWSKGRYTAVTVFIKPA